MNVADPTLRTSRRPTKVLDAAVLPLRAPSAALVFTAAWMLMAGSSARADWLVTRDGSRLETEGEWRVEGRQVIFTLPGGTLSALRLAEVDLEKSRAATDEARRPAEVPAAPASKAPKPEPVLVLTDKDIPKAESESGSESDVASGATTGADVRVIDWSLQPFEGGVMLIGRLENGTQRIQSGLGVEVEIRNEDDEVLAASRATLAQERLVAGGITVFRARFSGFQELPGTPHFVIRGANPPRPSADPDEDPDAG